MFPPCAVFTDVDNTLTTYGTSCPFPGALQFLLCPLHTMREVIVLANQEYMKSASEQESDDGEIIRRLKTVVHGKGWKVRDRVQQSLTSSGRPR